MLAAFDIYTTSHFFKDKSKNFCDRAVYAPVSQETAQLKNAIGPGICSIRAPGQVIFFKPFKKSSGMIHFMIEPVRYIVLDRFPGITLVILFDHQVIRKKIFD
jgi:hypothetical protein